jgi:nitrate/nitrite-specific signal transduction histidine kinase
VRRNVVKPLAEVMQGAKWISSGDFTHQIHESGLDELNNLARAINTMATELANQRERLALTPQAVDNSRTDTQGSS